MKKITYKGHTIEPASEQQRSGAWVARATVFVEEGTGVKKIPIFGRRRAGFDSQRQADSYALELAKLWVDGRVWGGNGGATTAS
ncbi:MAG: hypothetical protein ACREP8_08905 [Candidatus Binatia bacterium]